MVGAYCLSEPQAGSDALAAKTRADLSPDGTALHPQRPEDVDHERRQSRSLHRLRENRRRAVHGVPGRARIPRRIERRRRKEDGHQGQFHHARLPRQRAGAGRKRAGRNRPRPHHRLQHPEPRPPEARPVRRRRREERSAGLARLRERPQGLRHDDLAISA